MRPFNRFVVALIFVFQSVVCDPIDESGFNYNAVHLRLNGTTGKSPAGRFNLMTCTTVLDRGKLGTRDVLALRHFERPLSFLVTHVS